MSAPEVIRVGPGDWPLLEEVAALEREAFGQEALTPGLLALFAQSGAIFGLRVEGKIVAEALLLSNFDDRGALLFSLAVGGSYRRLGYGQRLMESVFLTLRSLGRTFLRLTVDPENRNACSLYLDRLGFRQVAEIPDCLGPGRHRRLLHRDL